MKVSLKHLHKRKRVHSKNLEKFPSKNPYIRFLDNLLLVIAVVGPLANIPQILRIFILKTAEGVSPISWAAFTIFNIPWILYGLAHKEKRIVIAYILWFITNLIVLVGTLIY
ncbi:hypothetical protein KY308_02030 [Candidatus Woesearchaeota archaeon]|nr:hypothetical protein [Candidatus Woesearchaeota archaeon]